MNDTTNELSPDETAGETRQEMVYDTPEGITAPPIDELLTKVSSKYALVIFAAKRARQINSFYQNSEDGVFEFIGPLVSPEPGEKPLSIALREIEAGLLEHEEGQ
ncbi:DNA-directed RNA polymerase subunit omega [Corynebacterium sp. BCW_4722]|nr:DNA-directed RNA polymerase subunit omega [Corynebacterium sp. BCW_4722]